ncbi:endonuclease domain-containing protein [Micromonospora sp. DT81.3]|uniref:endonuclease domain-containing protein n=1 Tax=Micromonospora sp. DT81.3 TaxID=3416523 RepID=UPI003CED2896
MSSSGGGQGGRMLMRDVDPLQEILLSRPQGVVDLLFRTSDLRVAGLSRRQIAGAIDGDALVRARAGVYLPADASVESRCAATVGGRLACVSVLARMGVFVISNDTVHVHLPRSASRLRDTGHRVRLHWASLCREPHPRSARVEVMDALIQATNCQPPRAAVATLDSALHLRLIDESNLDEIFAHVVPRRRVLRRRLDGRAESGPETLVRLIARALGFEVELQVAIDGVGRVDLVLDGWLVIECDSEAHHAGWRAQKRDRRRDLALAALGYATIRPIAEDILFHPEVVVAALTGMRSGRRALLPVTRTGRRLIGVG